MKKLLQICLLGGLKISKGGAPVTGFISNKVPALLVYLAIHQKSHQRESLASLLWGEMADADAKNNLRQVLSDLRKFFGDHLIITRETVQFNPDTSYELDVEKFLHALLGDQFREAMLFYQGDFMEGFYVREAPMYEEWVMMQQARLREHAQDAVHRLMVAHASRCEFSKAIEYGNRLLVFDPWREEIHQQLMLLQARNGQRSTALAQYQSCRSMLRKEFQAEPSAETTALYERIKQSMQKARSNLPAHVTGFVGRETEINDLRCLLAAPEVRLLTILGPGGIGKTRLGQEVAALCEAMFLEGVWFISLEIEQPARSEQLMLAVANTLGCVLSSSNEPFRELSNYLRQKELLLVLDNLEDHLEAIDWLSDLLVQARELKILANSRHRLNLQAEQVYRLGGLPIGSSASTNPEANAAWRLFVQRARRVEPSFTPGKADASAITQICSLVEGMPLGIELAAAWVSQFTCSEIAGQIGHSIDFLQSPFRDASPRHSTLRRVFEWSWNHLTPAEQRVFERLSVFTGPFSREAAIQVAAATPAILASLVDKSLAWRLRGYYQLHQVARQFSAMKLRQTGDELQVQNEFAHYYAGFLEKQGGRVLNHDQQEALREIENEFENIRSSWYWLIAQGEINQIASAIDGLYHFAAIRSGFRQALELFSAARAALQPLASTNRQAQFTYCRLLAREGRFLSFISRFEEANERLLQSLAHLQGMDEPDELAFVLGHLGGTARMQGNFEQAEQWLGQCLDLRKKTGNLPGQAVALLELGGVAFMRANYPAARDACLEGLSIAEKISDLQTLAHLLTGLGLCYRELGQHQLALNQCQRSQEIYEALGDRYGLVQSYLTQGELNRQLGKYEEAEELCQQAVRASQEIGHTSGEADGHHRLGQIALSMGDKARALHHQYLGLTLAAEINEVPLVWDCLYEIGAILAILDYQSDAASILTWLQNKSDIGSLRQQKIADMLSKLPGILNIHSEPPIHAMDQKDMIYLIETCLVQQQILARP